MTGKTQLFTMNWTSLHRLQLFFTIISLSILLLSVRSCKADDDDDDNEESCKSFTAFVLIQKDGGPELNATFLYSWTDEKEHWVYHLPNLSTMTVLTDFQTDLEFTVCSLTCTTQPTTRDQLRYWVSAEDDEDKKLPYQGTVNGVTVDIYSWVQGNTLISLYFTPNLSQLLRATFLETNSYVSVSFWNYERLTVTPATFATPAACSSCSLFNYDLIYGHTSDSDFTSPASTALVKSFSAAVASGTFNRFPTQIRASVVNFNKLAVQRLEFSSVKSGVLTAINNSTVVIRNRGDPFELCRWYFKIASPENNHKFVIYVSQGRFASPQLNTRQIEKTKEDGVIVFAATTDTTEDVSWIASFPSFSYTINNPSMSASSATSLTNALCSTTPPTPCSCAHNETCACGVCLCEFPWTNDYPAGITDCSICPRTTDNFCNGNGVVNSDCKTCTCTKPCANGGIRDPLTCECTCFAPFSNNPTLGITDCTYCSADGCVDCPCNSTNTCPIDCSGNGAQYPNCSCLCYPPWTNDGVVTNCSVCSRTDSDFCNGLGTVQPDCATCNCSPFDCLNNGSLSSQCSCQCQAPWTTHAPSGIKTCTYCSYLEDGCAAGFELDEDLCECFCSSLADCNRGAFNTSTCTCDCEQNWGLSPDGTCSTCTLDASTFCSGQGTVVDCETCQCFANASCVHGSLMEDCSCECREPWRNDPINGIFDCSLCDLTPGVCPGESVLDSSTCTCQCSLTPSDCELDEVLDPARCLCVPAAVCGNGVVEAGEDCDSGGPTDCCVDCEFVNEGNICTNSNYTFPYPCSAGAKCMSGVCQSQLSVECGKCLSQKSCDGCLATSDCSWIICSNVWEIIPGVAAPQRLCLPNSVVDDFPFDTCSNFVVCPAPVSPSPSVSLSSSPSSLFSPSKTPQTPVPTSSTQPPPTPSRSTSALPSQASTTPSHVRTRTIRITPSVLPTQPSKTPTKTPTRTHQRTPTRTPTPHHKKPEEDDGKELQLGLGLGLGLGVAVLLAVGGVAAFAVFGWGGAIAGFLYPSSSPPTPPSFSSLSTSTPPSSTPPSATPPSGNTPPSSFISENGASEQLGMQPSPEEYLSRENPLFNIPDVLCET